MQMSIVCLVRCDCDRLGLILSACKRGIYGRLRSARPAISFYASRTCLSFDVPHSQDILPRRYPTDVVLPPREKRIPLPPMQDHFDENHADDTIRLCRLIRCLVGENFEIVGVGRKEIENREPLEKIWSVLLQNGGFGTQEERNETFIAWKRKAYERVLPRSTRYFEFRNYFENFHQRR